MITDNSKWNRVYQRFTELDFNERGRVAALYRAKGGYIDTALSEDIMEECLQTFGFIEPKLAMGDGALEYEDAMAGNEIVANLTSERKI